MVSECLLHRDSLISTYHSWSPTLCRCGLLLIRLWFCSGLVLSQLISYYLISSHLISSYLYLPVDPSRSDEFYFHLYSVKLIEVMQCEGFKMLMTAVSAVYRDTHTATYQAGCKLILNHNLDQSSWSSGMETKQNFTSWGQITRRI